jgi:hypothetical protein
VNWFQCVTSRLSAIASPVSVIFTPGTRGK